VTDLPSFFWPLVYFGVVIALTGLFSYVAEFVIWGVMRRSNPQITVAAQRLGVVIIWLVGSCSPCRSSVSASTSCSS